MKLSHVAPILIAILGTTCQDVDPAPGISRPTSMTDSAAAGVSKHRSSILARSGASGYIPFCSGQKRATPEQIAYKGNVGVPGNYGCNMMLVPEAVADSYPYTIKFINVGDGAERCECWNKIGPDGRNNGFFSGNQALSFDVAAAGEQHVAFDSNTQGGCACNQGAVPLTPFGQFASTWVEFDFENASNNGHSGADASCLVAAYYDLTIPGLKVCDSRDCSIVNPGGTGTNAYLAGMEHLDGVGLNLSPGPVRLTVTIDYKG